MPRRTPAEPESWPVETDMQEGFSKVKALRALTRAAVETFDEARWRELGMALGKQHVVTHHRRLLRALAWGDDDYAAAANLVMLNLLGEDFENLATIEEFIGLKDWLAKHDPKLLAELYDTAPSERTVPLHGIEQAAKIHDVSDLSRQAARIRNAIEDDPALAIGSAKELLESVLKTILGEDDPRCPDEIPDLLKRVRAELDLDPKSAAVGTNDTLKRTLSSLGQLVVGTAEVRNVHGTGHGRAKNRELDAAHARLVVNSAITAATFLLEVWQARGGRA